MKTAEQYMEILKKTPGMCLEDVIEDAQKEAYNKALDDAVENAEVIEIEIIPPKPYDQRPYTKYVVNKDSILKLKNENRGPNT